MTDRGEALWAMLEARDAGVARLHAIEREQEALLAEKERMIRALGESIVQKDAMIAEKERGLQSLSAELKEKEAALRSLTADLKDKESSLRELTADVGEKEAVIRELEAALEEKKAIKALNTTLEEKEAVIREQVRALEAYRAMFAVVGVFVVPLNHLVLGVRSLRRRATRQLTPKLGVLYQHAPREMSVPASYAPAKSARPSAAPPRISIVTPSFRQAAFIERTLASVMEQGYPNLEYYVQDGGSDDGTCAILERYADRLAGWQSRPDRGQSQAINRGFAKTSGEIMAWLNSDDVLLPGALAYVADYFARNPSVDVIYGHRAIIDEKDRQVGRWILPAHDDRVLSWADYVPQESLFWRRAIWDKAGGRVDESFRFAMDWDLLVRFREAGARFVRVPRFLAAFRVHPQQKTSAAINDIGFEEMNRIRQRVLGRVPTTVEVRKAVLPYLVKHVVADCGWGIQNKLGFQP
jgi:GT2 family glycosyltransferase